MIRRPARLLYLDDPRFDAHAAPGPHPECPERLRAIRDGLLSALKAAGAEALQAREADDAALLRVHTPEHVQQLERALARGTGYLDSDTFFSNGSRQAARLAAGGAMELAERLVAGEQTAGVLAVRPPGHHATADRAMGFCLINNVAVSAAAALAQGLERVAIVDWDVHHGNGTQAIFEADPRVLFISLHQWPLYPGSGRSDEIGHAEGRGRTVNVPLPPGSGSHEYGRAFRQVVLPVLEQFRPQLVLVSCGFDAHADDPLAGMALADADFGAFTSAVWLASVRAGCSRLGIVLEGGYALDALTRASNCVAEALLGTAHELAGGGVLPQAQRAIDATRRALDGHWEL